jgi:hypothetical protein
MCFSNHPTTSFAHPPPDRDECASSRFYRFAIVLLIEVSTGRQRNVGGR